MAHTDRLLSLVDQFPQAFSANAVEPLAPAGGETSEDREHTTASNQQETADSAANQPSSFGEASAEHADAQNPKLHIVLPSGESEPQPIDSTDASHGEDTNSKALPQESTHQNKPVQPHLLALMQEFPHAFAETSETPSISREDQESEASGSQTKAAYPSEESAAAGTEHSTESEFSPSSSAAAVHTFPIVPVPSGDYDQALQRHISTFTWGEIQIFLTYSQQGLRSIWVTVGKSGTEVQSLCEAISRLINLLLDNQVPISDICRQVRGIRGADSEGLGPNRILGLADLVGKALHEAPERLASTSNADTINTAAHQANLSTTETAGKLPSPQADSLANEQKADHSISSPASDTAVSSSSIAAAPTAVTWTIPEQSNLTAMLCPECSAELQHMNGCSGGACPVCGYSSCS